MDESFKRTLREVYDVLIYSDDDVIEKIPASFLDFITNNMSDNYEKNTSTNQVNFEEQISKDAKAILALIYRDYLTSDKEREELLKEEAKQLEEYRKDINVKYNPENLFKNNTNSDNEENEANGLVEYKKNSIFDKIKQFIKKILHKEH